MALRLGVEVFEQQYEDGVQLEEKRGRRDGGDLWCAALGQEEN